MYASLLKILESRVNYTRFIDYIKEHTIPKEVQDIIKGMGEWYTTNPSVIEIDWDSFISWYKLSRCTSLSREKHNIYDKIFSTLEEDKLDEDQVKAVLEAFIEKDYAIRMADHLMKIAEGDDSKAVLDIEPMLKTFKEESSKVGKLHEWLVSSDEADLFERVKERGLEWRLEELNRSVGPLRKGDFVVISSVPDSGKTSLLSSESTFMAPQLEEDQDVLWFNNEEAGRKVRDRVYQAAIGWTSEEIQDNKLGAVAEIKSAIGRMDRIKVYDKSIMSWQEIEEIIESSNPGLIIIDQLWKVKGFERSSFSESDKMVHLFGWGRSLAQTYSPLITVHQADGTAYGEPYLGMEQLYMSRIGIQGEIDAMIGLGRVYDAGRENTRFIHIAKNKLDGGPRSVKAERNGKYEIEVDFDRVRFNGVYKRP